MNVQVLAVTMNQTDHSLLESLNIQTDALIGNQCNANCVELFEWKGKQIKYFHFNEKGVGLNRNNLLMRATADICLFADDDMTYVDNYEKIVLDAFKENPNADVIIFNLIEDSGTERFVVKKRTKVKWHNFMRYGAVRIAANCNKLMENGIFFNQSFGGGSKYRHGEDTLFLSECLKKKLKIIALPIVIAHLKSDRPSTWNVGYDDKYFHDQGKLYKVLSRRWWRLLCFQDAFRHSKAYNKKWRSAYRLMIDGGKA